MIDGTFSRFLINCEFWPRAGEILAGSDDIVTSIPFDKTVFLQMKLVNFFVLNQ